jgi:hypothetical protein
MQGVRALARTLFFEKRYRRAGAASISKNSVRTCQAESTGIRLAYIDCSFPLKNY